MLLMIVIGYICYYFLISLDDLVGIKSFRRPLTVLYINTLYNMFNTEHRSRTSLSLLGNE